MNFPALILIVTCLLISDWNSGRPVDCWWTHTIGVLIAAALVPLVAAGQSHFGRWQSTQCRNEGFSRASYRRMIYGHWCFWAATSLAIMFALRWPDVVWGNWRLDLLPIVGELALILPWLVPLAISQLIFDRQFHPNQRSASEDATFDPPANAASIEVSPTVRSDRFRHARPFGSLSLLSHFLCKFRWCCRRTSRSMSASIGKLFPLLQGELLLILFPILLIGLARFVLEQCESWPSVSGLIVMGLLLALSVLSLPTAVRWLWQSSPIPTVELQQGLDRLSQRRARPMAKFRILKTQQPTLNAVAVGFLPHDRTIYLTQGLVEHFPANEVLAIAAHEVGHLRHGHIPYRMFFLTSPLILAAASYHAVDLLDGDRFTWMLAWSNQSWSLSLAGMIVAIGVGWWGVRFFRAASHQLELEADLDACLMATESDCRPPIDVEFPLISALQRMGCHAPEAWGLESISHPSLARRVEFLTLAKKSPDEVLKFRAQFFRFKRRAIATLLTLTSLLIGLLIGLQFFVRM